MARNGDAGEQKGKPTCGDVPYKVNAGLMSPYPGGLELPEPIHEGPRKPGAYAGRVTVDAGFFEPLPDEELDAWER